MSNLDVQECQPLRTRLPIGLAGGKSDPIVVGLQCKGTFLLVTWAAGSDELGAKPIIQLREIKVPALPIPANWVSWECPLAGFAEDGFGMHPQEASSVS